MKYERISQLIMLFTDVAYALHNLVGMHRRAVGDLRLSRPA
jgi:hypothetical protein